MQPQPPKESRDGSGAGDHDKPYTYSRPWALCTFPFSAQQFGRLLSVRSRVNELDLKNRTPDSEEWPRIHAGS